MPKDDISELSMVQCHLHMFRPDDDLTFEQTRDMN